MSWNVAKLWGWLTSLEPYFEFCNYQDRKLSRTMRGTVEGFILSNFWLFQNSVSTT